MNASREKGNDLSFCGEMVYGQDRDRFLSAMTAPPERREALFALYAFNQEVSKTAGVVSEPMLGQIRLQWWREAIEECYAGTPRRHAVVTALAQAIGATRPTKTIFDALIEGREADLDFQPPQTMDDLERYAAATSGGLTELALEMVTGDAPSLSSECRQAARRLGTAWAMVGLMRALPFHSRNRRGMLPRGLAGDHGVSPSDLAEGRPGEGVSLTVRDVCRRAAGLLEEARSVPSLGIARSSVYGALSIGVLTDIYLRQLQKVRFDVFDSRLANPPLSRGLLLLARSFGGRY